MHIPASYSNNPDHDHDHGNDISWGSGDSAPHPLCGDALGGEVSFPTDAELQGGLEDGLDSVGLTIAQPEATPTAAPAPVHIPQFANKQQLTLPAPSAHGIAVKAPFLSHSGARDEEQYPTSAVTQMQDQVEKEKDPLNRTMEIVELPDSHVAGGISYYEVGRGRANSINSLTSINSVGSAVSSRTGRSTAEAAHANHHHHHRQQHHRTTPGTYSGVTEIKISRKSAPGEQINSTSHTGGSPQVTAAARKSSGKKISISSGGKKSRPAAARTPSPMLRNAPSAPSSGHVGDSLSGRTVTVPSGPRIAKIYTPASYSASFSTSAAAGVAASAPAVVTPATGSSSKASRLLSAYSQKSAPKKSPSGSKIKSSNLRSNSLMY